MYDYSFISMDTNHDEPNGDMPMQGLGGSQASLPLLVESECTTLLAHQWVHQPGSSTQPASGVFTGVSLRRQV